MLHAGPAAGHAAVVAEAVKPAKAAPVSPTVAIENAVAASESGKAKSGQTVETPDGAVFVPSGLEAGQSYPLVVAFAYDGDPNVPFQVWKQQGQQNHWLVYASKDYKNPVLLSGLESSLAVAAKVKAQVDSLATILPVDRSRIIFTGMSGGGNYADFMNLTYPGYAAGVIINSGRIPSQLFGAAAKPGVEATPTASAFDGSRRVGVFLASPSDSAFYGVSQANAKAMQALGWDTLFLGFPGGHKNAPPATYARAIAWITSQPSWTTSP